MSHVVHTFFFVSSYHNFVFVFQSLPSCHLAHTIPSTIVNSVCTKLSFVYSLALSQVVIEGEQVKGVTKGNDPFEDS